MAAKKKKESMEEQFQQIDAIITSLEQEDTTLADAVAGYAKGVQLINSCKEELDEVEKQIRIVSEDVKVEEADER